MTLEDAYNVVRTNLQPQIQGTCGLYSFYNAVQIMRQIDPHLPNVPSPRKPPLAPKTTPTLRSYAKREFKSGQGEVLTEAEMVTFIKAWGYETLCCGADSSAAETDFITMQTKAGRPVMIAYLADGDSTGVIPVPNAATADTGAHWSLLIGAKSTNALVVEPNAPTALKIWSMSALLLANAAADVKKFERYWSKTDVEYVDPRNPTVPLAVGKDGSRGIKAVKNHSTWAKKSETTTPWGPTGVQMTTTETGKLYDLGGDTGTRHTRQKLSHVIIAILPPS